MNKSQEIDVSNSSRLPTDYQIGEKANKDKKIRQNRLKALVAAGAVLVGASAGYDYATALSSGTPQVDRTKTITVPVSVTMGPNQNVWDIVRNAKQTGVDTDGDGDLEHDVKMYGVDKTLDESGIDSSDVGRLQPGTKLVIGEREQEVDQTPRE